MKKKIVFLWMGMLAAAGCGTGSQTSGGRTPGISINYDDLNASDIPADVLSEIQTLDVYFEHASVGQNIMGGLEALETDESRYTFTRGGEWSDDSAGFNDTTITDWFAANNGFGDNARGNPGFSDKVTRFDSRVRSGLFAAGIDVAMFKFCYIDSPGDGDAQTCFNQVRTIMEGLQEDYPDTVFVWWTMPIEITTNADRQEYNELVRTYCLENDQWLLDIADIECHDPSGTPQADASGYERLFAEYASDDYGHLNTDGSERVARAWWVLLARIAGWG
jgi:hypothetical protein